MVIEQLSILNFKNIAEADLRFSPNLNCLFGNNGMGKTNLLDALYYLSFAKNHNNLVDSQLIRHEEEFAVLQGLYADGEQQEDIYCGMKRKHRKVFKRNKKEYERLSEHIGLIPLVLVSPDDTEIIQGGSAGRRKFVDMIISQYDREYLRELIAYNKALAQRNALLKKNAPSVDPSLFDIFEEQMVASGHVIYAKRKAFLEEFLPLFEQYYRQISQGEEQVGLNYTSQWADGSPEDLLKGRRERDRVMGFTTAGVHKDDFEFLLDDYLIRKIGSQGQNKTYLISLKLAQFSFLIRQGSSVPILLLDDIFDKLDAGRVEQIVHLVSGSEFGQIFITDTNRKYLDAILASMEHDYKLFEVEHGQIRELV
ncbi:DNA replication/repair protein RecF [Bacteroidales bacterium OttesenSCG-928-L03]|nr:DNA replication/repair protein RecF [Bacteroidales bacterium OttesenSCG-928-L03]